MASQKTISSIADVQKRIGAIIVEINTNPGLALSAAVNPILALEELGYVIDPEARSEIEERVRFSPKKAALLRELRADIFRVAGHSFDLQSDEALTRVLEGELKLPLPRTAGDDGAAQADVLSSPRGLGLSPQVRWVPAKDDVLEPLRGAHPIMEPLLEYRRLEASEPRIATRELYEEVRQGKRRTPVVSIKGRLKSPTS